MGAFEGLRSTDPDAVVRSLAAVDRNSPRELVPHLVELEASSDERISGAAGVALSSLALQYADHLTAYFDLVPHGPRVVEKAEFEALYAEVCKGTANFAEIDEAAIERLLTEDPRTLLVFRLILRLLYHHLTELLASEGVDATSGLLRSMEHDGKLTPKRRAVIPHLAEVIGKRIGEEPGEIPRHLSAEDFQPRGREFDTEEGWASVRAAVERGVPYHVLLYQRYVGGFYRQVRDMYSEKKGNILEDLICGVLDGAGVGYYRTEGADQVPDIRPAPDFLIPDETKPTAIIEGKIADNGGTARDKAARIHSLSQEARRRGIVLVAVIDGIGFRRHGDVLVPIVRDTLGLTFSPPTLDRLVEIPAIKQHAQR